MSTMQAQERGGCLTAWLALMALANAFTIFSYLTNLATYQQLYPSAPSFMFILLAGLGVLNLVCVYGLWTWKKWGFYLFLVSAGVSLVINLVLGIPIMFALFGLVGVAIVWFLLRNRWQSFT
jgi:uncharacterized membrane protein (DUF2068 family)